MIRFGKQSCKTILLLSIICSFISCSTGKSCKGMIGSMLKNEVTLEQISSSSKIPKEELEKIIKGQPVSFRDSLSIVSVYRYYIKNGNIDMLSQLPGQTNTHYEKSEYINRERRQHSMFVDNLKTELRDSLYRRADKFILYELKLKGGFALFKELFNKNQWKENVKNKLEYYLSYNDILSYVESRLIIYYRELNQQRIANIGVVSKGIPDITIDKTELDVYANNMYANFIYTILKSVDDIIGFVFYPIELLLNLLPNFILILLVVLSIIWIIISRDIWGFIILVISVLLMLVPDPNEKIRKSIYTQIDEQIEQLNIIEQRLITNTNNYYETLYE